MLAFGHPFQFVSFALTMRPLETMPYSFLLRAVTLYIYFRLHRRHAVMAAVQDFATSSVSGRLSAKQDSVDSESDADDGI